MDEKEVLTTLLGEIKTANAKAQFALTMAQAIRAALSSRLADFESEYVRQLESLLSSIPPMTQPELSIGILLTPQRSESRTNKPFLVRPSVTSTESAIKASEG